MSPRRARVALAALIAAALVALLVPVGLSLASAGAARVAPRFVSTEASKRAARQDIHRRIAGLTLPTWAERVSRHSPLTAPRLRGRYPYYALYLGGHEVSTTAFLSFRGGQRAAVRWFLDHPPPGTVHAYRWGGPSKTNKAYRCLVFELTENRPAVGGRQLALCAVRAHGRTSVRVDALSVWLEGRSRYERIPRGSRFMEVTLSEGGGRRRSSVVADPDRIDPVVELANSLPVTQRSTCAVGLDPPSPSHPRVEVRFRSSRDGWPIARLVGELGREGRCPPALAFSLRGRKERSLEEGRLVFQALHQQIERLRR